MWRMERERGEVWKRGACVNDKVHFLRCASVLFCNRVE